ncbi:MAG: endolytic transglycosylase MltG [Frisingicoccus sp.]|nr:endolytic transglycosylase MltG [Frisingicoccus sp.]
MIKKIIATIMGLGINIVIYAVAIFVLIRVGTIAYDFSYEVFGEPVVSEYADEEVRIEVVSGDGGKSVAAKLKEAGVIDNELAFVIKARLSSANLMPGTYIVKGNMSADDMIEIMSDQANSVVEQPTAEELEAESGETESAEDTSVETSEGEGGN